MHRSRRVLLIAEDRLLNHLYRARFEASGFHVDAAQNGAAALKLAAETQPDAVLLDPVTSSPEAGQIIHSLRADAATQAVPIIALPTNRPQFSDAVQHAGASRQLARAANPFAAAIDAVETALGIEPTAALAREVPFVADDTWIKLSVQAAPDAIAAMRKALHDASRDPHDASALRVFLQLIHNFTEQVGLLGLKTLFHLGAAIEMLADDLVRMPERSNASTIRTLGQAVDFISVLFTERNLRAVKDPSACQVLVVDDEAGMRKIIMAAIQLVGLKSAAADTPSGAFAALEAETFDLILLDIGMPEMSGFEVCSRVRALPHHERTPIVFITGMATFQNRVQSNLSGGNDFIGKPFHLSELAVKALVWVFRGQLGLV